MVFHAASMAAFFVDSIAQAPVVVQCAPTGKQDPLWARLLLAAIPSIFALGIAWFVFRWNAEKDRVQWVLDNKKAEWQELLGLASAIEQFMPSVSIGSELTATVHDPEFRQHLRNFARAVLRCTFISGVDAQKIYDALLKVQLANEEAKGHIEDFSLDPHGANARGIPRPVPAARQVQSELVALWRDIRRLAVEDLDLWQRDRLFRILAGWVKRMRTRSGETGHGDGFSPTPSS